MSPDCVRISARGGKHAASVRQIDCGHAVGRLQEIVQQNRRRRCAGRPSASFTAASFARFFSAYPNWTRQRKNMLVTMPWRRQTAANVTSGRSASCTMASFSSSVKLRRFERRSHGGLLSQSACQGLSGVIILSSAARTAAYLRAGARMKMGALVDLHLAALKKIAPAPQAIR